MLADAITAANALRKRMTNWTASDNAIHFLSENCENTLIRVTVLNALYGTNVYAIFDVAKHIDENAAGVVAPQTTEGRISLVNRLACTPNKKRVSFASKYCHFFIDSRIHIKDTAACLCLKALLPLNQRRDIDSDYGSYVSALSALQLPERISPTELDSFLWLGGLWLQWKNGKPVNKEAERVFDQNPSELRTLVAPLRRN
jgi:hypothetical protein